MNIFNKIKTSIKKLCLYVGALVLIVVCGLVFLKIISLNQAVIPENSYLMIDFNKNYPETVETSLLDDVLDNTSISHLKLLQIIEVATFDSRIKGIVANIENSNMNLAQIQDVARAIVSFKSSGKKTIVFSRGFGSLGQGNREYYLASFFDKIYMQPHTNVGLTGISIEVPFAKKMLKKLGVTAEFYSRYEYKNAYASLTEANLSSYNKEELQKLGKSLMSELELDIMANRQLKNKFMSVVNQAPLTSQKALEMGLIDGIMYQSELEKQLSADNKAGFIDIMDYNEAVIPNSDAQDVIVLLNINGTINSGENEIDINGEYSVGSKSVLEDIAEIKDISNLKAVIVRIDSPGGDYNAADEIYFALKQLKTEKKVPLVVSQSGYAASGGYFISLAGDKIVAEPTTITGSIGVLGGKFVFEKLWNKLGVNWQGVKVGKNADILSINKPFSDSELKIFNAQLDDVYNDFTGKVVENRTLKTDIDKIARGRVWTGRQALELGLIDELGGLGQAFALAKTMANIENNASINLQIYPDNNKNMFEKFSALVSNQSKISAEEIIYQSGVDIRDLKLFKRLQYDTVLLPIKINM